MKTQPKTSIRGRRSQRSTMLLLPLGLALAGCIPPAHAESVDSEIVLLVDVTRPGFSSNEFNQLMDGYADAFTSSQVLDSIQSGATGRIAVSLMFFGNSSTQIVGIPWMSIGNLSQAEQFAALARSVARPFSISTADVGAAIDAATFSFGTETGGTSNGFESATQVIEIATAKIPPPFSGNSASAESADALTNGVDLINSIAFGNQATAIDRFYTNNVIGSTIDGVNPSSVTSGFGGALASTVGGMITDTVQNGANVSVTAVPEPSTLWGLVPAALLILRRRR